MKNRSGDSSLTERIQSVSALFDNSSTCWLKPVPAETRRIAPSQQSFKLISLCFKTFTNILAISFFLPAILNDIGLGIRSLVLAPQKLVRCKRVELDAA
jgi:hypothetical protein